ncbi:unnamed protein product [Orchesella dallaii]|uniref:J domain-containing protein n=1 Tax=Orchesella dallaii TaxID=48710 RepID=A0ABP1RT15_9HEXA
MVKCYYTILGLSKGCREDEIKKQYKKLAKQYHPDKNTAQNAEEVFKDIDKSYRVLMDKKNREIYDLYGEEGLKKAARAKAWASTSKLEYPLRVTIEELANGCTKKVRISRNVVESDEKRRVEMKMLHVSIQKGSKPGTRILFRGEGDRLPYKVPGDIIFILKVKPSNAHPPHPHPHCHPPFFSRTPHHQQEKQQNSAPPPPAKPYQPEEFLVDKLLRERSAKLKSASSGPEPEPKRNTTDSPFNSATSFEELPLTLNVIAQAQSGTGKTAALVIAMLNSVRTDCLYPQVLCLCPTSELALQIGQMVLEIGQFIPGIRVGYAVSLELGMGDATLTEQVLIGTPGKVKDWAFDRRRFDLGKITSFYLDEADSLIATQGYRDQCIKIHRYLINFGKAK